jgi:hypothetical protein
MKETERRHVEMPAMHIRDQNGIHVPERFHIIANDAAEAHAAAQDRICEQPDTVELDKYRAEAPPSEPEWLVAAGGNDLQASFSDVHTCDLAERLCL